MSKKHFHVYIELDDTREVEVSMHTRERTDAFHVKERPIEATEFLEVIPKLKDIFKPGCSAVASKSHLIPG